MPPIELETLPGAAPSDNDLLESLGQKLFNAYKNSPATLLNQVLSQNDEHRYGLSSEDIYKTTLAYMLVAKANGMNGIKTYDKGIAYLDSLDFNDIATLDQFIEQLKTAKDILKTTPYEVPASIQDPELRTAITKANSYNSMTLASRIDAQYEVYQRATALLAQGPSEPVKAFQAKAKNFLEFTLDTSQESKIHELMAIRLAKRDMNPEFIPGKTPLRPMPTALNSTNKVRSLFIRGYQNEKLKEQNKLLGVSDHAKEKDAEENTRMLDRAERDDYRVIIHNGKFYQRDLDNNFTLADTEQNVAKSKTGHASYVLNNKGELSIFNHTAGDDNFFHSSPNAQAHVMGAGDLKIENGQLSALSTDSGHYLPDMASAARVLQYFHDNDVDISQTLVTVHVQDPESGSKVLKTFNGLDLMQNLAQAKEIKTSSNDAEFGSAEAASWAQNSDDNWGNNFDNSIASTTASPSSFGNDDFATDWSSPSSSSPKADDFGNDAANDPFFDNNNDDWGTFPSTNEKEAAKDIEVEPQSTRPKI